MLITLGGLKGEAVPFNDIKTFNRYNNLMLGHLKRKPLMTLNFHNLFARK